MQHPGACCSICCRRHGMHACGHVDNSELTVLHGVVDIEDDNTPAPENIPTNNNNLPVYDNNWHHNGSCFCCILDADNVNATIKNWPRHVIPTDLQLFEHLFPCAFVKTVMLPKMNATMPAGAPQLQYGEFVKWIRIWFLMATTNADNRRDFWSQKPVNMYSSAPFHLHDIMSRNRFEQILSVLTFTDMEPPPYLDRFWEVRQMLDEWNTNMDNAFAASWISCIDESMSKWVSQYTCPGFMVVPQKPWLFENEYHSISCGKSNVIYRLDLVEGKDTPRQHPRKKYSEHGKTIGTMMQLAEPLFGKISVLLLIVASVFCLA